MFTRGKVKNLLFTGMPLICDKEKYKDLAMICNFLKGQKPPIISNTDVPDHYLYSFFSRVKTLFTHILYSYYIYSFLFINHKSYITYYNNNTNENKFTTKNK